MNDDAMGPAAGTGTHPERAGSADLIAAAVRDIDIGQVMIASGLAASLRVGRIEFGQATVDQLVVAGASANIRSGHARLQNVQATVQVTITVGLHVGLPWPIPDIDASVDIALPVVTPPISEIEVPTLQDIALAIPTATINGAATQIAPVSNLDLGSGAFNNVSIVDTKLPTAGFDLFGLQLGAVALSKLGVPEAATRSISLGEFKPGGPLVLPAVELANLQLPSTTVPEAFSTGNVFLPGIVVRPDPASGSLGSARVTVSARVLVAMRIGRITVRNLSLRMAINQVRLQNTRVPVTIRDVVMGNIGLEKLTVNQISL